MTRRPPRPTLFPYPPLFRSAVAHPPCPAPDPAAAVVSPVPAPSSARCSPPALRHHGEPAVAHPPCPAPDPAASIEPQKGPGPDRKSTRLNSSHSHISYALLC